MTMTSGRERDIDGGWAWVVLAAAFINLLIGPGLAFVGGMFQTVFLEYFQQSVALTAWVTSLFSSQMQLAGPASSLVSTHLSCRVSVMAGSVLLALGLFVSSFVHSIQLLMVFMGVIAGLGLGLTYSASVVIVNIYFNKMRIFVTGLALSASGAGCFALPLLCRHLFDVYSWRESLSILAGISLQMAVCGALMFPLHEKNKQCDCGKMCFRSTNSNVSNKDLNSFDLLGKTELKQVNAQTPSGNLDTDMSPTTEEPAKFLIDFKPQRDGADTNGEKIKPTIPNTEEHSTEKSKMIFKHANNIENTQSLTDVSTTDDNQPLFTNIGFILLCFHLFLSNASCGIYLIHFPSFARELSVSDGSIAFAMAMNGPALTVSRILLGALGNDERRIDPMSVYVGVLLTAGVVICVTPVFATRTPTMIAAMVLYGIYYSGSYAFLTALTIDCVGLKCLTSAFGWEMICAGSGYLVAPPIAGWIVDITGYYSNGIYLSGGLLYVSVLVLFLVPVFRVQTHQRPNHPTDKTLIVTDTNTEKSQEDV